MAIDYKRELEIAAKNMILVHEPDVLIKMIVRMLVQKVKVIHAGILLHNQERDTYILTVSKGPAGLKIPEGFARVDTDNALIRFFREDVDRKLFDSSAVTIWDTTRALKRKIPNQDKELLKKVLYQMEIFDAVVCIPSYFRKELVGVVLLGAKKNGRKFSAKETDFFRALASDMAMAIRNAQLFRELEHELARRYRLFLHTTIALAAAIDAKDHYTHGHTTRVTNLTLHLAQRLALNDSKSFSQKFLEDLHIASLLHDIGKIGIPESILNKDGPLNDEEKQKMMMHPVVGATILEPIKELEDAILGVKYHHEKFDGTGYPQGLKGEAIPIIASIIAVADSFDAMTTNRPYRQGLSKEQAVEELKKGSNRQFDPRIVDTFVQLCQEGRI